MEYAIADTHPHIASVDTKRYPIAPIGGRRSNWSKTRSVTLEELIDAMDAAGVDKAAVVQSATTYGFDNSYVADAVALHPERLTGVFSIDVMAADAPDKMRYWYSRGLTGMRIFLLGSTVTEARHALDDPATMPAWNCASELGMTVVTNLNATSDAIGQIESVLRKFPDVKLLLDHLGHPPVEDGPPYAAAAEYFRLAQFPNFYLKFTLGGLARTVKGSATVDTFMRKLVTEFGADHIAWGSNFPSTAGSFAEIVEGARLAVSCLAESDREWIMGKTAQLLYPALAT